MNYLVFLDASAGELEKILSGTKSMVVKEFDPAPPADQPVKPGDRIYFLRSKNECTLQVKAIVTLVRYFTNNLNEDQALILKEMQPRLQLTEEQYNYWSAKGQMVLVEFGSVRKIGPIHVATEKISGQSNWIEFEAADLIAE